MTDHFHTCKIQHFAIKSSHKYVDKEGLWSRALVCVRGGPKYNTKVLTPNRKRRSKSLIAAESCRFRVIIKELDKRYIWGLIVIRGRYTYGPIMNSNVLLVYRRNIRKADPKIT